MTDLDRLDALAAAATPGPWVQSMFVDGREYDHMSKPWKDARQAEEVRMVRSGSAKGQHVALAQDPWNAEADAAFIAACDPATIRDLVAAVRERDELREALRVAARGFVWTLFARDQHDNEGHNLPRVEAYLVRRWTRSAALHSKDGASDE